MANPKQGLYRPSKRAPLTELQIKQILDEDESFDPNNSDVNLSDDEFEASLTQLRPVPRPSLSDSDLENEALVQPAKAAKSVHPDIQQCQKPGLSPSKKVSQDSCRAKRKRHTETSSVLTPSPPQPNAKILKKDQVARRNLECSFYGKNVPQPRSLRQSVENRYDTPSSSGTQAFQKSAPRSNSEIITEPLPVTPEIEDEPRRPRRASRKLEGSRPFYAESSEDEVPVLLSSFAETILPPCVENSTPRNTSARSTSCRRDIPSVEDFDPDFDPYACDEEEESTTRTVVSVLGPFQTWLRSENFEPLPPAAEPEITDWEGKKIDPMAYLERYLPDGLRITMCDCSNTKYLIKTGKPLNLSESELKRFFGIVYLMSCYGLPNIEIYWAERTRIHAVADHMPKNRFRVIRNNLKVVVDNDVRKEDKASDAFWKLKPLLDSVRRGCLENKRSKEVSIDEQMVPFHGKTKCSQFVRGKPNPKGLKNFEATTPDGLPLDFFLFQGKGDTITDDPQAVDLDIAGKVVVTLSETLVPGSKIYMDRYFTSIPLLDVMHCIEIQGCGTLQKSRIPSTASLPDDKSMAKEGRGSMCQLVRDDGQIANTKWFDNKPVIVASSCDGKNPVDVVRRYSKAQSKFVAVKRPYYIQTYNKYMGGVNFLDRVISYYRNDQKTCLWTVRSIMHMHDFVTAASWIEQRRDAEALNVPKRKQMTYLDFKLELGFALIFNEPESPVATSDEEDGDPTFSAAVHNNWNRHVSHPPQADRKKHVRHIPVFSPELKNNRCRMIGCKSNKARIMCRSCKVFLCLTTNRNCFQKYHDM